MSSEWQYKNRTYVAQIKGVDATLGTVEIDIVGGVGEHRTANIPFPGLSVVRPTAVTENGETTRKLSVSGYKAAWQRYMPRQGDFVRIAYGPLNQVEVLGYTAWGSHPTANEPYTGGYAHLREHADAGRYNLQEFVDLQPGEWDMRSSGGAYIQGDRGGNLTLRGGVRTSIRVSKPGASITARSDLFVANGDGCEFRIGTIKRPPILVQTADPFNNGETVMESGVLPVSPVASTAEKELRIRVAKNGSLAPGATPFRQTLYEVRAGHLVDATLLSPILTDTFVPPPAPARYQAKFYSAPVAGFTDTTLLVEVDILGNTNVAAQTPTGNTAMLNVSYGSGGINARATGPVSLASTTSVHLGTALIPDPAVNGTRLAAWFSALATTLVSSGDPSAAVVGGAISAALAPAPSFLSTKVFLE